MTETKVEQLRRTFQVCDGNDDNRLAAREVELLFEMVGLRAKKFERILTVSALASDRPAKAAAPKVPDLSFAQFLVKYGRLMNEFATLPSEGFLARCKRLKLGFQKCDPSADAGVSYKAFEIALQKLGVIASDDELTTAFDRLDRDGDGMIEWSDVMQRYWRAIGDDSDPTRQCYIIDKVPLDALGDLPTVLLPTTKFDPPGAVKGAEYDRMAAPANPIRMLHKKNLTHKMFARSFPWWPGNDIRKKSAPVEEKKWTIEQVGVKVMVGISQTRISQIKMSRSSKVAPRDHSTHTSAHMNGSSRRINVSTGSVAPSTGLSLKIRRAVKRIEFMAILIAAVLGVLFGLLSLQCEDTFLSHIEYLSVEYYAYLALINLCVSLLEISCMFVTALVCAFQVTVCTNLVLYPLDREREFLVRSIARAALQVPPRSDKIFGIDPARGAPPLTVFLLLLMHTTKRYVLRFMLKLIVRRMMWRAAAKTLMAAVIVPMNGLLDAWTLWQVMLACRVTIIGPPCAIAVLERLFLEERGYASPFQRVDYLRVVGCVTVCKRCIPSNIELMVNRMRQEWLREGLWPRGAGCTCFEDPQETCLAHPLDDMERLLVSLMLYSARQNRRASNTIAFQHTRTIFLLLIVALIIDGNLEWAERRLYMRACRAANMQNEWKTILRLKNDYLDGKGIQLDEIHAIIKSNKNVMVDDHPRRPSNLSESDVPRAPWRESASFILNRLAKTLSV
ncbi:TPA: hypothetical protein N0F65_002373 [Lagenidium giganteum]|uniref:EF-hand domain-containing protein n=1 Tax=Lagenidium giganteum TaxID=4803 RepID=A0AAV2YN79_9STRA|nr:TPA: hypothetical protein N0F65_002373 [Lagenidium giganteum]